MTESTSSASIPQFPIYSTGHQYNFDTSLSERERHIRAAAFLDGEGSILINASSRYSVRVAIASSTMILLEWFRDNYGGSIYRKSLSKKDKCVRKPAWDWVVGSALAERFLYCVSPYLLIKQEQAIVALELRKSQRGHYGLSPDEKRILWHPYYERIKMLNSGKR